MKIRSVEELVSSVDQDLAWRKKDISVFTQAVRSAAPMAEGPFVRAGVALLYAHWEGFVKHSSSAYLHYVGRLNLPTNELAIPFVGLALRKSLSKINTTADPTRLNEIVFEIFESPGKPCPIPWKDEVSADSNLSSEVLRRIITSLGLNYAFYETKEVLIDESLLGNRNKIAHGRFVPVTRQLYLDLKDSVVDMLEVFRNEVENAAVRQSFKRA